MAIQVLRHALLSTYRSHKFLAQTREFSAYFGQSRFKLSLPFNTNSGILERSIIQNRSMSESIDEIEVIADRFTSRELKFDNPYGDVAAQEWGNPHGPKKIFCVHGWLDNSGSFKHLIPAFLNLQGDLDKYHVVALDMPGVGHSSHLPTGATYSCLTHILEIRRIVQKLKWEKFNFVSHSLGAHLSYIYSSMYPKQVESMVSIDLPHPMALPINHAITNLVNSVEEHFKCEYSHGDDPTDNMGVLVYSRQDAIERIMQGHSNSLTRKSSEIMLERGARKERWGYTFNRDVRLRYMSLEIRPSDEQMYELLDFSFRPNLLCIEASLSPYKRPEALKLKFYEMFRKKCPLFQNIIMEGTHHLHMNDPIPVAREISKFFNEVDSKGKGITMKDMDTLNRL